MIWTALPFFSRSTGRATSFLPVGKKGARRAIATVQNRKGKTQYRHGGYREAIGPIDIRKGNITAVSSRVNKKLTV